MIPLLIVPVVVALSLCLLPPGRQAAMGIAVASAFLAILWFAAGGGQDQSLTGTYIVMAAPGVALAALAHLTHRILGPRLPVWGYALAAVVLLFLASAFLRALAGN
ncbi:MAG: hypothetical protein V2I53_15880 [Paracoccaceae bacterium]|jgi:hypothetical protein|nr:hypothetical protein [Paracoccaceae bacterium]